MTSWLFGLAMVAVALGGCANNSVDDATDTQSNVTTTSIDPDVSSSVTEDVQGDQSTSVAGQLIFEGLPEIGLTTSANGGGIRPLLEWTTVVGANHYGVYLYAPSGSVYWAWRGTETEVYVGGSTLIDPARPGPSIVDGMSWAVVAFDADLLPLASSVLSRIDP